MKEEFIEKHQIVPVYEYKNQTSKNPLVTVCVLTYQHKKYIADCLDGILMQKTNFDFEVLVGEDDSSDGTREICIEYAKKYPKKIKLFLHSRENNIKVYGKPSFVFNFKYNMYQSKGKYIAMCEGDDFWTDPFKLQKQVDFLQTFSDFGMVYSDIKVIDKDNNEIKTSPIYKKLLSRYTNGSIFWELLNKNFINTLTVCVKKELVLDYLNNFPNEAFFYDYRIWLHVASYSKIKFINKKLASYRVHDSGMSKSNGFGNKRVSLVKQSALLNYFSMINHSKDLIDSKVLSQTVNRIYKDKNLTKKEKEPIIEWIKKNPFFFIRLRINYFFKKLFFDKNSNLY